MPQNRLCGQSLPTLEIFAAYHPLLRESYVRGELTSGVGAERVCETTNDLQFVERVLEWQEGDYYVVTAEYTRGRGAPIKDYRGTIRLDESDKGTRVTMTTIYTPNNTFASILDVLFMKRTFKNITQKIVDDLKNYVEEKQTMSL